jgi:PhzF family phenazine biosynthesis protein
MRIPLYQIDAFTDRIFGGNPAAICPLDDWLDDDQMQFIASENNLSETAFFVGREGRYKLRWFTPKTEVDLCGHATLAAAHLVFSWREPELTSLCFETRSGSLQVRREAERLVMDFPAMPGQPVSPPPALVEGLGVEPETVLVASKYLAVLADEAAVRALKPDFAALMKLDLNGVIATAAGTDCDFVSRYFAPRVGIPEDPVTGSAHCTLVPYWSIRLDKIELHARQISARGGELWCQDQGERVSIAGQCALYLQGEIDI